MHFLAYTQGSGTAPPVTGTEMHLPRQAQHLQLCPLDSALCTYYTMNIFCFEFFLNFLLFFLLNVL